MADGDAVAGIADVGEYRISERKNRAAMASAVAVQRGIIHVHAADGMRQLGMDECNAEMLRIAVAGDHFVGHLTGKGRRAHAFSC